MSNEASLAIKIAVDSGPVKSNLDQVKEEFRSASAGISSALKSIQGFAEIERRIELMTHAYGEAQRKVAELAKEIKTGGGGAALAKDFEQAKAASAKLKAALSGQQQELQRVRTALSAAGVSTVGLSGQQQKLQAELEQTKGKYQELATIAGSRDVLGLRPHADIQAAIQKTRAAYSELARSGKLSLAGLAQEKVAMRAKIDELTKSTNGWRDALDKIKGRAIEVGATLGVLVVASRSAITFESAMADVQKTVGGTKEELKKLGGELRDMSHTIPMSADQLAKIAASGGQLGIAAGDIGKFTQVTAKMAVAFDMTADSAGDSIGKIKNVYQLTIPQVEGLGDSINQLGNTTAARERDIVDVMLRVGGTSKQFGLAKEQTAALAAAMLSLGKAPEVAGTSINSMLNTMQTATMGSKDFKEALGKIGMSAEQMAAEVAKNPQKALDDLLNTLSKLQGQERAEVLTGLFGKEFQDDIGVLVGSLDTYKEAMGQVADKTKYAGSMQKEFETRSATTEKQLQLLKNVVSDIVRGVGDGFLPAIVSAAKVLQGVLIPVTALVREFPRLTALIVTAGAGFVVFNTATKAVDILRMAVTKIGPSASTSFGVAGSAVSKLTGLLGPALKLVAAFSAGWTFGTWLNQFSPVQKGMTSLIYTMDRVQLAARKMWATLTGGDVAGIDKQIDIAKQAYTERLAEIDKGDKGESKTPEKNAAAVDEKKTPENEPVATPKPEADKKDAPLSQMQVAMDTWKADELNDEQKKERLERLGTLDSTDEIAKKKADAEKAEQETAEKEKKAEIKTKYDADLEERKTEVDDVLAAEDAKKRNHRAKIRQLQDTEPTGDTDFRDDISRDGHDEYDDFDEYQRDERSPERSRRQSATSPLVETPETKERTASEELIAKRAAENTARIDALQAEAARKKAERQEAQSLQDQKDLEELTKRNAEAAEQAKQNEEAIAKANADRIEAAKKGADEVAQAEVKAADQAKNAFQKYFDKVKSLQSDIAGREKSLAAELTDLDTRGTAESKWRKQAKDAKEYEKAAKAALKAGDLTQALALSDQAKEAYRSLKDGAGSIPDQMARSTALRGVKSSGELGIDIAKMLMGDVGKQIKLDLGPAGQRLAAAAGQSAQQGPGRQSGAGGTPPPSKVVEIRFKGGKGMFDEPSYEAFLKELEIAGMSA